MGGKGLVSEDLLNNDSVPILFWGSSPVGPGDGVLLYGGNLEDSSNIQLMRLPDDKTTQPSVENNIKFSTDSFNLQPIQAIDYSVKFIIPKEMKPGIFAVRVEASKSQSNTILLNAPNVWWLQGDSGISATPGGWIRIFGISMSIENSIATVLLKGTGDERLKAESDEYSVRVNLPESLSVGEYQVFIYNGHGNKHGWSLPLTLTIKHRQAFPTTIYDVTQFGAIGDGRTNDTEAIKKAIEKAEQNVGGIIYFPRGRYLITETIELPRFTILRGEKREFVNILWPDMDEPLPVMIKATSNFGIEDLTFYCTSYGNFLETSIGTPESGDVHLKCLRVRANRYRGHPPQYRDIPEGHQADQILKKYGIHGGKMLQLSGNNIEVIDCDFYTSGATLFLTRAHGARITGNEFAMGRYGWYWISGCDGVIFEKNIVRGADLTTWGGGINCLDGSSNCQNVYFADNIFKDFWGGDREAMTTDAGGGAFFGGIESVNATEITLAGDPNWARINWIGACICVLGGKGMGQYSQIVGYEGRKVRINHEFSVPPDENSIVTIVPLLRRYLILRNDFSDLQVVQFYGSSIEHIVASNRSFRTDGFRNHGMCYGDGNQPSWYIQYLGNEIVEGNWYGTGHSTFDRNGVLSSHGKIGVWAFPPNKEFPAPLTLGTIVRHNHLHNNSNIEAISEKWIKDVIIENNLVENNDVGIDVSSTIEGILLRNNKFNNVKQEIKTNSDHNKNLIS